MKYYLRFFLITILLVSTQLHSQNISIGERHSFDSQLLGETRSYQIYLPPSYFSNTNITFPVLYLLDGDYNFHYDSGLIEFLSNSAFTIPEMILVGISDNGGAKQLENSDPKKNADEFIVFIRSELKPLINKTYRTNALSILAGHSKFGILATHYWLKQPDDFNVFIAIDPSYWFNEYEIVKRLDANLQNGFNPKSKLYIAQANTQDMGIDEFSQVLKKEMPNSEQWQLKQYPKDNHGSLHLKAITDALNDMFKGWDLDRDTFYSLKTGSDVVEHYKKLNTKYNSEFLLPWYSLSNIIHFYSRKERQQDLKQLEQGIKTNFPASLENFKILLANNYLDNKNVDEAEIILKACLLKNPKSYKALEGLSKVYKHKKNITKYKDYLSKAIILAKEQKVRQYYLNELNSGLAKNTD